MAIPKSAYPLPIQPPNAQIPPIQMRTGQWTNTGLQWAQQIRNTVNGLPCTFACDCDMDSNKYTFTPLAVGPSFLGYAYAQSFAFTAPTTSTGAVTATVQPNTGVAPTLKVFKNNGATQATTGDIVAGLFYLVYYVDSLDSNNGGFVLK